MYLTNNKILLLTIVCSFLILPLLSTDKVFAVDYFVDNFNRETVGEKWDFVNGQGSCLNTTFSLIENKLVGDVTNGCSSYLYSVSTSNLTDYELNFEAINVSGVDQNIIFRVSPNRSNYYLLGFRYKDPYWPQDNNNVVLYKFKNGSYYLLKEVKPLNNNFELSQNTPHNINLIVSGGNIKVYFDHVLLMNINDIQPFLTGGIGFLNWGGNYFERSSKNIYDNVRISSIGGNSINKNKKIIIIPGLGASWNSNAMVYNQNVDDNEWKMTPFVKVYDNLINGLERNGLIKNQDFLVWNYDWRKPIGDIVQSFSNFVNLNIDESEKVDLVGHSLGGLIARTWAKDNIDDQRLGKLITIASPDKGVVDVYELWNGGEVPKKASLSSIGFNILLQLQKAKYNNNLDAVRGFAPVIKDLLPVFEFVKKNNTVIPLNNLESQNNNLTNLNNFNYLLLPGYKSYIGIGKDTKEWVFIQDRSIIDKVIGIWPDGRPTNYTYNDGDDTVLKSSAINSDITEITTSHESVVNRSVDSVLIDLGIEGVGLSDNLDGSLENSLVFFVGSPADLSVSCDNGNIIQDTEGFVFIKNEDYQNCQINLTGTGEGKYHLVTGNTDNSDSWQYYESGISIGETKKIIMNVSGGKLISNNENINFLYELILEDINNLKSQFPKNTFLSKLEISTNNKDLDGMIKNIFHFRKGTKEMKISKNIIDNIETLLVFNNSNFTKDESWKLYIKAVQKKSVAENLVNLKYRAGISPDIFNALSYKLMIDLIMKAEKDYNDGNFAFSAARSMLALNYWTEI